MFLFLSLDLEIYIHDYDIIRTKKVVLKSILLV